MILAVAKVLGDKNNPKDTEYTGQKMDGPYPISQ